VWLVADVQRGTAGDLAVKARLPITYPGVSGSRNQMVFAALSRLVQCCGLSVASHRAQEVSRVGSDGLCRRMLWSQGTFVDGEGALVQRLGLNLFVL
jgi:hypothetical protein